MPNQGDKPDPIDPPDEIPGDQPTPPDNDDGD